MQKSSKKNIPPTFISVPIFFFLIFQIQNHSDGNSYFSLDSNILNNLVELILDQLHFFFLFPAQTLRTFQITRFLAVFRHQSTVELLSTIFFFFVNSLFVYSFYTYQEKIKGLVWILVVFSPLSSAEVPLSPLVQININKYIGDINI